MSDKEINVGEWTVYPESVHACDPAGACLDVDRDKIWIMRPMSNGRISQVGVPLAVMAEFLRACGYVVVNPVLAGKTEPVPEGAEERCVEMLNANSTVERVR